MILIIDNYDSFTYNLCQYAAQLGFEVTVARNDQLTVEQVFSKQWEAIIISPGPCGPEDAGICLDLVRNSGGHVPILGVCLGHQVIGAAFGASVIRAPKPVHGKQVKISHSGQGVYAGLSQPFVAGRYHSLVVDKASLPACLEMTAWTDDGLVMGLKHRYYPIEGVQFHPESILTPEGLALLGNFLDRSAYSLAR